VIAKHDKGVGGNLLSWMMTLRSARPNKDWYFFGDGAAYVVTGNLRALAAQFNPKKPWLLGQIIEQRDGLKYPNLQSGMLVSSSLIEALAQVAAKMSRGTGFDEKKVGGLRVRRRIDHAVRTTDAYSHLPRARMPPTPPRRRRRHGPSWGA